MRQISMALCFLMLMTGCAHMSVKHLPQNQLLPHQTETISLDFWDFLYTTRVVDDVYSITGKALPNMKVWPGWAEWFQDLTLTAYFSDAAGNVLAWDDISYPVRRMQPEGLDFSFAIPVAAVPESKDVFLTFGYRMSLTRNQFQRPPMRGDAFDGEIDVFSAQRGALPRGRQQVP